MKTYVTFGQDHVHHISGKVFDKDCVAVIEGPTDMVNRAIAMDIFNKQFFTSYSEDQFPMNSMRYFPRGFIEVN